MANVLKIGPKSVVEVRPLKQTFNRVTGFSFCLLFISIAHFIHSTKSNFATKCQLTVDCIVRVSKA